MKPKTLQQRIVIFILIPVFFILAGMGWISFLYARNAMLAQWGETAVAKLQKAAHMIDMRLSRPKDLLLMLENNYGQDQSFAIQLFIVEQLQEMEGVVEVNSDLINSSGKGPVHMKMHMPDTKPMHYSRMENFELSLPQYNAKLESETISLSRYFKDDKGGKIGRIEVVISFQDLIDQISKETWWKSNKAFLIDTQGNILTGTQQKNNGNKSSKFAESDPLEKETIDALTKNPYGTIFGPGHPPEEIIGYYHLNEAPWSLVLISPGRQVLKSIVNFRTYYFVIGLLSIFGVILFIRMSISNTTNAIKKVSEAAKNLSNGVFGEQLLVQSKDEVGELTYNFNKMTKQLQERIELKEAMNIAMEVQQNLLPPADIVYENLEISGRAVYCDETGGDFFDIIEFPDNPGKICVAVGDVVGHGIGAALLMATARALLRGRITKGGSLPEVMNDVNRLLCLDSKDTGSFVTLFLFMVDVNKKELRWVRAGHDPAMVYHPDTNSFTELYGDGIVLGLDEDYGYTENVYSTVQEGSVILIGTDGVWEVENESREHFGKKRIEAVLQKSSQLSSAEIVNTILSETEKFRGNAKQMDDITLLVLKFL